MSGKFPAHRVKKHLVINFADHVASVIQLRQYASVLSLDQVTDDLIVEIIHLHKQKKEFSELNRTQEHFTDFVRRCRYDVRKYSFSIRTVSYTHLTLPTKRIV